ncbi:hypothetical protein C2I18_13395 [Paenibacillus sp. PK3_47]|uniref:hypothetical protein n=1 Tax=Paenibacillus sp. PK3_47 TaxID=2072642 RepID=UPI00201D3AC6|nr:hypothetical protein [Paenibacillus sp. PK3_47]UQZ34426.1 hypothetical protein C2I18_13395 [Paenibacillus sp. PK3_47]
MTEVLNKVKLSQWDALLLESLRSRGWSDEQLLDITGAAELPADESVFQFDYQQLQATAKAQPEEYRQAVTSGYQIKYNTLRGIRSWIVVALGIEGQLELEAGKEAVEVALTDAEKERLEEVLSFGWHIVPVVSEDRGPAQYRIEPVQR